MPERAQVVRLRAISVGGKLALRFADAHHRSLIAFLQACWLNFRRRLVAQSSGRKWLNDLHAAAVAMHVAEAAQVHDNIEAQALPGSEGTQHFIMASAMPKAKVDDLAPARLLQRFNFPPQLTIRIQALLVEQCSRQLHFKWFVFVEQINWRYGLNGFTAHQLARGFS